MTNDLENSSAARNTPSTSEVLVASQQSNPHSHAPAPDENSKPLGFKTVGNGTFPPSHRFEMNDELERQVRKLLSEVSETTRRISELNEITVAQLLPNWLTKLEADSAATRETAYQAERSLRWAKWAITASVAVAILTATWQAWLAKEYKQDGDRQQAAIEEVLRSQLAQAVELNRRLAEDSKPLLEAPQELGSSKSAASSLPHDKPTEQP